MKIKKGDKVEIRTGKDAGKSGKVTQVNPSRGMVAVEGLNLRFKHLKSRKQGEPGQRIQFAAAIPASRVMLVCPSCGKPTRVGYRRTAEGKKLRSCSRCKETFA